MIFNFREVFKYEMRRYGVTLVWMIPSVLVVLVLLGLDIEEPTIHIIGLCIGVPMGIYGQFRWTKKHPEPSFFK